MKNQNVKKLTAFILFATVFCWCAFTYLAPKPFFDCDEGQYTFYLYSQSSNAKIITVNGKSAKEQIKKLRGIKGQSVFLDYSLMGEQSSLNWASGQIASKNATLVFKEEGEWGKSEYYYSPLIANFCVINGNKVNLHMVTNERGISIGSPLLFGSY